MTYSSVSVMALVGYEEKATGAAIMSFITMSVTLVAVFVLTLLPRKNPLMMRMLFIVILAFAILAFWKANIAIWRQLIS
ncbi:hypothetical protein [Candidatus Coxiella mudrowiae]|uniref:hypothetical protein n=1 Tax=Candidatus Coxiella mudrowiae TaxID=2054173 RepID=UPI0012FF2E33|nr:hypothetical protein [Candidatus Coxiella mudrowiae]